MTQHLDMSFAQSFDASDWARSFVGYVNANPVIATDEATMIGWFANALMRGFDEANRRRDALPLPAGGETPETQEPPRSRLTLAEKHARRLRQQIADHGCPALMPEIDDDERFWCPDCVDREQIAMLLDELTGLKAGETPLQDGWQDMKSAPTDGTPVLLAWEYPEPAGQPIERRLAVVRTQWQCRTHAMKACRHNCPHEPDCDMRWGVLAGRALGWMRPPSVAAFIARVASPTQEA
jgi:hypothetical protein